VLLWLKAPRIRFRCLWIAFPAGFVLIKLLLVDNTMTAADVYAAFILSLLVCGPWAFSPYVLRIPTKLGYVADWYAMPEHPFPCLMIDIRHDETSGLYGVYLKDTDPPPRCPAWETLAWQSHTEAEARDIAAQFRDWGIGAVAMRYFRPGEPIAPADRKFRLLFIAGHILSVVIFIAFLVWVIPLPLQEPEPQALLRIVRYVTAFLLLSPIPFALYLCWLGRRAIRHRQMPPPATRLLINTKPLAGNLAVKRGRLLIAIGLTIITLGLTLGLYLPHKLTAPLRHQLNRPSVTSTLTGAHP
jgi:hypothetical protein